MTFKGMSKSELKEFKALKRRIDILLIIAAHIGKRISNIHSIGFIRFLIFAQLSGNIFPFLVADEEISQVRIPQVDHGLV